MTLGPPLLEIPIRIGIFGEFSSGKSTLLNSVLGKDIQASHVTPTTSTVCVLRHPDQNAKAIPIKGAVHVGIDHELTRFGAEFWDTPGPNSESTSHRNAALGAMDHVDIGFYLVDATKGVHKTDIETFRRLDGHLRSRQRSRPLLLLSHTDRVEIDDDEEWDEIIEQYVKQFDPEHGVAAISAKDLSHGDGAALVELVREMVLEYARNQVVEEFTSNPHHWMKCAIANREDISYVLEWPTCSDALRSKVDAWSRRCARARRSHRMAWLLAWFTYPFVGMKQCLQWCVMADRSVREVLPEWDRCFDGIVADARAISEWEQQNKIAAEHSLLDWFQKKKK